MNILIFGSSGMLGGYISRVLKKDFNIYSINRKDFDVETKDWILLEKQINNYHNIKVVINCVGLIPHREKNIESYFIVNTIFPLKLSEICLQKRIKLIHITTDCVFDGKGCYYIEKDMHTSDNIYGISKSLGENSRDCIIRTSIIGEEKYNKKGLLEWVKTNKNKQIHGYYNHVWNGLTCLELSKIILEIIKKDLFWKGVRHIYSETVTKYSLCLLISDVYDLNINVKNVQNKETKDMTLSTMYIPFKVKNLRNQLEELKEFGL